MPKVLLQVGTGYRREALAGNAVKFYSLGAGKKLTIQGRSWPFVQEDIVPLGYKATAQGNYTIGIDHLDEPFNDQNIYLEDKALNVLHDLKAAPYSFTSNVGEFDERFVLRYTNQTLSTAEMAALENNVILYTTDKVNIRSTEQPIKEIMIYDLQGKLLLSDTKVNANEFTASTLQPTQTTLLVNDYLKQRNRCTQKGDLLKLSYFLLIKKAPEFGAFLFLLTSKVLILVNFLLKKYL